MSQLMYFESIIAGKITEINGSSSFLGHGFQKIGTEYFNNEVRYFSAKSSCF